MHEPQPRCSLDHCAEPQEWPPTLGPHWEFSGTSGRINGHYRETSERPYSLVGAQQPDSGRSRTRVVPSATSDWANADTSSERLRKANRHDPHLHRQTGQAMLLRQYLLGRIWGVRAPLGSAWGVSTAQPGTSLKERRIRPGQSPVQRHHSRSKPSAGQLHDVRAEVVGLDHPRHRAALAQGRHVTDPCYLCEHRTRLLARRRATTTRSGGENEEGVGTGTVVGASGGERWRGR